MAAAAGAKVLDDDGCAAGGCSGGGSVGVGSAMVEVDVFFLLFDRWRNSFRRIVADGRQLRRGQQQQVERSVGPVECSADVFVAGA